jgi:hypothetical protein
MPRLVLIVILGTAVFFILGPLPIIGVAVVTYFQNKKKRVPVSAGPSCGSCVDFHRKYPDEICDCDCHEEAP